MSGSLGFNTQSVDGQRVNYTTAGISGSLGGALAQADLVYDGEGGSATELSLQTRLSRSSINFSQLFLNDFTSDGFGDGAEKVTSRTRLSANTRIPLPYSDLTVPFSLSAFYDILENDNTVLRLSNSTGLGGIENVNFSNSLSGAFFSGDSITTEDSVLGSFQANLKAIDNWFNPRMRLGYTLRPDVDLIDFTITNSVSLRDNLTLTGLARRNFSIVDGADTYGVSLNYDSGQYIIAPELQYTTDGDISLFLSLRSSIIPDSLQGTSHMYSTNETGTAKASVLTFIDHNLNGVFDEGDEPAPDIGILTPQAGRSITTDGNGYGFINRISAYRATDVVIDDESIGDPSLAAGTEGYSILPRPGKVFDFELPVVTVGEIDGFVYKEIASKGEVAFSGVTLSLYDAKGQKVLDTRSAYDGFYQLLRLDQGIYVLEARRPTISSYRRYITPQPKVFEITSEGELLSGLDFVFRRRAQMIPGSIDIKVPKPLSEEEILYLVKAFENGTLSDKPLPHDRYYEDEFSNAYGPPLPPAPVAKTDLAPLTADAQSSQDPVNLLKTPDGSPDGSDALPVSSIAPPSGTIKPSDDQPFTPTKPTQPRTPKAVAVYSDTTANGMHLTSYFTLKRAEKGWKELQQLFPEQLNGMSAIYRRIHLPKDSGEIKAGTYYRVIAMPRTSTKEEALRVCAQLSSRGQYCHPVRILNPQQVYPPQSYRGFHLASYKSLKLRERGWRDLRDAYPILAQHYEPVLRYITVDGERFARLLVVNSDGKEQNLCEALQPTWPYCEPVTIEEDPASPTPSGSDP